MQIGNSNSSLNSILESDDKQPLLDELPDRYSIQTEYKIVEPVGISYELLSAKISDIDFSSAIIYLIYYFHWITEFSFLTQNVCQRFSAIRRQGF